MISVLSIWLYGLGASVGLVCLVWLISLARRDAGIIDIFWGPGFALLAWVYAAAGEGWPPRTRLMLGLVSVWALRLAAHIFWRGLGQGEDYRYREMRERHGARFPWVSLFTVFLLQGALLWLISAPLLQAATASGPTRWTPLDLLALGIFLVGFLFESIGDLQLARFRSDLANRGKVLRSGLWRYTRHPNYFGDAVIWWSFFLLALATPGSWWTIHAPALMTWLLLKVSGVRLLEQKLRDTRPDYADYVARTNAFVPWFPRSADRLPGDRGQA